MLGEKLRTLRKEKGLSQQAVADYLEIALQTYNNYENEKRDPKYDLVFELARFYDVSIYYFVDDEYKAKHCPDEQFI